MLNFIIENIKIFLKTSAFHGTYKANPVVLLIFLKKKNVRNKLVHGIKINEKGCWSGHALEHVIILACEVVICLDKWIIKAQEFDFT